LSKKCPVTRTWARRGQTPVIQQSFSWSQMSAIAGLSWWRFYFRFFKGTVKSEQVVEFLAALKRQIAQKLLVIWDGAAIHRSRIVRAWLEQQGGQVHIAELPPYAPELNPVEAIWGLPEKARDRQLLRQGHRSGQRLRAPTAEGDAAPSRTCPRLLAAD
jgi:transposase